MTIGAIVVPLIALAVCAGGAWLAWRLVGIANAEEAERPSDQAKSGRDESGTSSQATAPDAAEQGLPVPAPQRSGIHLLGLAIALAAILLGLGGVGAVLARALGINTSWLLLGYAMVLAIVVGVLLAVRSRHRKREPKRGR